MFRWSLIGLLREPLRLMAGSAAVASAFILVIFFQAVFEGESEQIVAYPEHADADVWVMQKGVSNMHMASSLLWDWKQDLIARLPGVAAVESILYMNTVMSAGGMQWFSYVVGLDEGARRSGPWSMATGRAQPAPGEAVIPAVVARLAGVGIGDAIAILDRDFRVVGLSLGTFSMANSVTFVAKPDLADLMDAAGSVSYVLVKATPGVSPPTLARRIMTEVEKVNALPRDTFIHRDREMAMQMGTEIIRVMTLIGALLATLIVAFTAYSHVARKQRELALAKALGFYARHIYISALVQTAVITALGYVLSVIAAYTLLPLVPRLAPQISLAVSAQALMVIGVVALPVAALASVWPARVVARVDPLYVFQS